MKFLHSAEQFLQHRIPAGVFAIFGILGIGILFFHEPLFSGGLVNATDILTQQYFWNVFTKENLFADPCFQTWMPYINAGTPFSGGLDLIFRPITFLAMLLLPVHTAINYEMVIHIILLGVGMYLYMRELKVSHLGAFFAALFLMLNGEIVTLLNAGHVNKIGAIFPLTFVFWAFERALQRKTLSAFVLTGVVLGFQFWQGHVQISFYTCIAIAIYYIIRMGIQLQQERRLKPIWKLTAYALIMVLVFLLLSAVNFLPLISFAQVSERAEGVSYDFATSWSMPPEEFITYLVPGFFGFRRLNYIEDESTMIEYWGRMPFTQTGRYFGILPLILALIAICFVRNRDVLTLSVLGIVVLLLGMGKYIPFYRLLYEYAPGFDKFRVPQMILFLFAFAAAGLSGLGAEWLFHPISSPKEKRIRTFLMVLILLCLASWILILMLPNMQQNLLTSFHEAFSRNNVSEDLILARFQNIQRGVIVFNLMLALTIFAIGLRLVKRLRLRWVLLAVLGVSLIDLWWFNEKFIATVQLENSVYTDANDTIRYNLTDAGLHRLMIMTNTPTTYNIANKTVLYKLFSVSGYEAVGVQYYNDYLRNMALGSRLVDLLNIKYIALPRGTQLEEGTPANVGDIYGPFKVVMHGDALLLENLNVLPRAYAVHNAYIIPTTEEIFAAMYHPDFDPHEYVIFEEPPQVQLPDDDVPSSESKVEVSYYMNRTIQLQASMATDGFVVLSEKYYPGWKAYVDGKPTPIYKANYTLHAIVVPQGEHTVTFAFQPTQFILGFSITTLTCLLLLCVWIVQKRLPHWRQITLPARVSTTLQHIHSFSQSRTCIWAILCFGIILHTTQYLSNRSLNVDESGMAVSILDKSLSEILPPFSADEAVDYNQTTPPGFLLLTKFCTMILGDSEYALRLVAFLCGILSIFLFWKILPYFLKPPSLPLTLLLFTASDRLIHWSSSLKQYSSDVCITLLLYVVTIEVFLPRITLRRTLLFGSIGALAIWFSHPSIFVLAGIGTCLFLLYLKRKDWSGIFHVSIASCLWLASFSTMYLLAFQNVTGKAPLQQFWGGAFVTFPPTSFADVVWPVTFFIEFCGYAVSLSQAIFRTIMSHSVFRLITVVIQGFTHSGDVSIGLMAFSALWVYLYGVGACLGTLGGLKLFLHERKKWALLISPLCFAYLASILHKYPFAQRLLLFFVPATLIFMGEGIRFIKERTSQLTGMLLIGSLLLYPVGSACYYLIHPRTDQEIKPVLRYVEEHSQEGDTLYVYYGAKSAFTYYARRFNLVYGNMVEGIASREDWNGYMRDLEQLRGNARVWVLFSHDVGYEKSFFLQNLVRMGGPPVMMFEGEKASVYLFNLGAATQQ